MAAAFADSLARAFDVPAVRAVDYYLTESPDEMNRIVGVDWLPSSSDGGAFSSAADHLLISGNPAVGENYRHEIVHLVLDPIGRKGVHSLLWEGVATWLGGTLGMSASQTRLAYASYLRAHPDVTLEGILHESIDRGFRPAGSVLIQMAFQRGGTSAVKTLLGGGFTDEALIASLERLFGMPWAAVQAQWRREALR
jgi:hypothetical protein